MGERVIWGGRYAIYDELASGGMATVYLAARLGTDSDIPQIVALKKLAAQFAKQPEFVAMFLDEAHLAARIRHPNVVVTYEFLRTDEGLGIVMELVIGESMMQLVRGANSMPQAPPPLAVSLAIVTDALDGLHAAHQVSDDSGRSLNLVHRDVSPHNIIVGLDGVARVIDFGIAKAAGRLQVTEVGVLKGKFAYMAPEQIHGSAVDRRTDVYATGIVLWEALAGRKLFRAATNEELFTQRSAGNAVIPKPSSMNGEVPPELDAIVARALASDPSERFGSALAMADALRAEFEIAGTDGVSEWVKSRAGEKLAQLEVKRRRIEESLASDLAEAPARESIPSAISVGNRRSQPGGGDGSDSSPRLSSPGRSASDSNPRISSPGRRASESSIRPPGMSAPQRMPERISTHPSTMVSAGGRESLPTASPAPRIVVDIPIDDGHDADRAANHFSIDVEPLAPSPRTPSSGGMAVGRSSSAGVRVSPLTRGGRSYTAWFLFVFLILLLGVTGAVMLQGPALLKTRVLATATAYGLSVTLDHVELSHRGLLITGVKALIVGCPGVRLSAGEVVVVLDRTGTVESVVLPGYELTITGTPSELSTQIASWRQEHHRPLTVSGKAGHVTWTAPTFPALALEALDVSLEVSPSPEATFALDSPSMLVNLARGHMGPWRAHLESSTTETRAKIALDPSVPDAPPSATLIHRQVDGSTWALDIPRESTFKIGLPTQLFGMTSDLSVEVALHAHLTPSGDALTAEAQIGLYGWPISTGRTTTVPVDLVVSGTVAGDPAKPLAISGGKLTFGKTTNPVGGSLVTRSDGVRIEIDRPFTHAGVAPALVLDTHDWTSAHGLPAQPR